MHQNRTRILALVVSGVIASATPPSTLQATTDLPESAAVSLEPSISFVDGTDTERQTVLDAAERFNTVGLALPDLTVRIHADNTGCDGHMGLFHHNDGQPAIDLCFDREFLALHELAHAWEHYNLNNEARERFVVHVGAPTWDSSTVHHHDRGIEIAADAVAHGLLSAPLTTGQNREREFANFQVLTGMTTPRLDGLENPSQGVARGGTPNASVITSSTNGRPSQTSSTSSSSCPEPSERPHETHDRRAGLPHFLTPREHSAGVAADWALARAIGVPVAPVNKGHQRTLRCH